MKFGARIFLAACVLTIVLHGAARASVAPSRDGHPLVTTVAKDFSAPSAVAFDKTTGSIVVVDSGANQIDRVAPDGSVARVAGSERGYRDGGVAQALFDAPSAVAIEADGAIVVADTGNRRVRRIRDGVVTTVAARETFIDPVDIATGPNGRIYVADAGSGIREIAGDGAPTMPFGDITKGVTHLAIWNGVTPALFFVTTAGVGRIDLTNGTLAEKPLGGIEYAPANIVALDATQFVASLPRYQALYVSTTGLKYGWWRRVAGSAGNDATLPGAFADGSPEDAHFASPGGMALDEHGNILVADTGNHRIRRVPALDLRWDSGSELLAPDPRRFRIGFVSNSVAFYNTMWQDSIGGALERTLATDGATFRSGKPVEVKALWLGNALDAQVQYFENAVVPGTFDCVVWALDYNNFNDSHDWPFFEPPFDPPQITATTADIARGIAALRKAGAPTVLTDVPFGFQAAPVESIGFREQFSANASPADVDLLQAPDAGFAFVRQLETVLGTLHVPFMPSQESILSYERGAHAPLYPPGDNHFSPAGATFFGTMLAGFLESSHACDAAPQPRRS